MHTEHLYIIGMTAQQIDYSFIAIASSALGKSLRKGISLKTVFAFNDAVSEDYVMISLYNDSDFKCVKHFSSSDFQDNSAMLYAVHEYCLKQELFRHNEAIE